MPGCLFQLRCYINFNISRLKKNEQFLLILLAVRQPAQPLLRLYFMLHLSYKISRKDLSTVSLTGQNSYPALQAAGNSNLNRVTFKKESLVKHRFQWHSDLGMK